MYTPSLPDTDCPLNNQNTDRGQPQHQPTPHHLCFFLSLQDRPLPTQLYSSSPRLPPGLGMGLTLKVWAHHNKPTRLPTGDNDDAYFFEHSQIVQALLFVGCYSEYRLHPATLTGIKR